MASEPAAAERPLRLLVVTDAYPPEIRSAAHLMHELAEGLHARGHEVHVLTCWPQYNLAAGAREMRFERSMDERGIHVVRLKTLPHHKVGFVVRGIAQLVMPAQFLAALGRHLGGAFDGVIVYSPPLPLALVGAALARCGARFLFNVQDIFPQNAIDLGALNNPLAIGFFRWLERRAYRTADLVAVHSEGNRAALAAAHPALAHKFAVLHNWVEAEPFAIAAPRRDFRAEWGLAGKRIALFAGVMGPSQDLDVILAAAGRLREFGELVFLFVGDGTEQPRLARAAAQAGLGNVLFRPFVSREDYPALVAAADIGMVCLSARNKTPVVPGKILGYMAGARPVAAFLNAESDGHAILRDADCGYACRSDRPDAVEAILRRLYGDPAAAAAMGARGQDYARRHFARAAILGQIEAWLRPRQ